MSEFVLASLALFYAGWIGHGIGHRAGIREGVGGLVRIINPTHLILAQAIIEGAQKVHDARRFSGPGVHIHNEGDWTIEGIGRFKITIEEKEPVDA